MTRRSTRLHRFLMAGATILAGSFWSAASPQAASLETIEPGKLTVAFNGDMPATGFQDGRLIGVDGELMHWIADSLGLKVVPALMEWSAEIASVQARRVDIMHGSMGWSDKRAEVMLLSDPIYYWRQAITQKKTTRMCSFKDLEGKRVGAVTGVGTIPDIKKIPRVDLRLFDTTDAVIRDLQAGRIDAIFVDPIVFQYALSKNPTWDIHSVPVCEQYRDEMPILTSIRYSVFGLNKAAPQLHDAINAKIQEAWSKCINQKLAAKYGLGERHWFDPGDQKNYRHGVDRPASWPLPRSPANCPS